MNTPAAPVVSCRAGMTEYCSASTHLVAACRIYVADRDSQHIAITFCHIDMNGKQLSWYQLDLQPISCAQCEACKTGAGAHMRFPGQPVHTGIAP